MYGVFTTCFPQVHFFWREGVDIRKQNKSNDWIKILSSWCHQDTEIYLHRQDGQNEVVRFFFFGLVLFLHFMCDILLF